MSFWSRGFGAYEVVICSDQKLKSSIGSVDSSKYLKTYILTDSFHDGS